MPVYFFHLAFGDRVSRDEEGVELRDRSAAHDEALAIVQDLSARAGANNRRRWASWFLVVADQGGTFERLPLGYPALEVVTNNRDEGDNQEIKSTQVRAAPATGLGLVPSRADEIGSLAQQASAIRSQIGGLLERHRQLKSELSVAVDACKATQVRTMELFTRHQRLVFSSIRLIKQWRMGGTRW